MATLVTATVPASEFALAETLAAVPGATFSCERIVETGPDQVMPLLWVHGTDHDRIDAALREDPTTDEVSLLTDLDEERLYRLTWSDRVQLLVWMLTNGNATILDMSTKGDEWLLRILFPDHDALSRTSDFCEDHDLTFEVKTIREMDGEPAGRYGLTEGQFEALTIACERGYFAVPREIALDDLASEMGISHQALSERLRRGHHSLIEKTIITGDGSSI